MGFVGSVEGVDIKETKTRSCDGFFVGHLERRRRYHHLRLYLDDGHHATLQCMAIRTDGPMLGESHDLKLGVEKCEYRTCQIPPPYLFYFWIFQVLKVNEGRFDRSTSCDNDFQLD